MFTGPPGGQDEERQEDPAAATGPLHDLRFVIEDTVEPGVWEPYGEARVRVFDRSLVVRAPVRVHEQIAGPFYFEGQEP